MAEKKVGRGKVEAHYAIDIVQASEIFEKLGKNSSTGFPHFVCPSYNADLKVDPLKVISAKKMISYHSLISKLGQVPKTKRYIPLTWGVI